MIGAGTRDLPPNVSNGARAAALAVAVLLPTILTVAWVRGAAGRLAKEGNSPAAAALRKDVVVAAPSDEGYCSPELKRTLRRVVQSCGLSTGARGCQPLQAKTVASLTGGDFNALFAPMKHRGAIVEFGSAKHDLDADDQRVIDEVFADRKGASYFFVVGRASPDGDQTFNRELSRKRAEAVMGHLRQRFQDPELEQQVGLLWLGADFAQLERGFCDWRRSAPSGQACDRTTLNRSAFVAWIDCRL
jgi:outer membrane protein OmpA-like peptidoglycan-associated protein